MIIDRLMRENDLAAILVIGPADHNPYMYYFTGGHHISTADLVKITGKKPVLFYNAMEREEAAATGLKTIGYARYKFMELLKQAKGDQLKARVVQYKKMFTDLGLTKGRVMIYGKADAGWVHEITKGIHKVMPGIDFVGDVNLAVLPTAMQDQGCRGIVAYSCHGCHHHPRGGAYSRIPDLARGKERPPG